VLCHLSHIFSLTNHSLSTEKMDNLTKQLFDDVQKEEQQRMYEIWFALKLPLPSLSAVFYCFSACRYHIRDTEGGL
jgi:Tfp pilus assembly ATPase PilU